MGEKKLAPKDRRRQTKGKKCGALCCSCRISVSSSEDAEGSDGDKIDFMSTVTHAIVQERLEQLIQGSKKFPDELIGKRESNSIIMIAVDKLSYDPREDFRSSMLEIITANRMEEPKELRCLLNCYISINSEDCRCLILQVFHEVCTQLFTFGQVQQTEEKFREVRGIGELDCACEK